MATVVEVSLPRSVVEKAKRITGEREPGAALAALVRKHESEMPNAATARALRAKRRGKVFGRAQDAIAYLKGL